MPINPITLDKIDYNIIRQIETKVVDRIVHETKGVELQSDNNNKQFDFNKQRKAIEDFAKFLSKFGIKFNGKIVNKKIKVKIVNIKGEVLIESYVEDIDSIYKNIQNSTGSFIDIRG